MGHEISEQTYCQAFDTLVQFRSNEELITIEDTEQAENEDELK